MATGERKGQFSKHKAREQPAHVCCARVVRAVLLCTGNILLTRKFPTLFVQMEYVRCFEELRALQALKDNSRSFAVALPGGESRSLQSRAQDDKLLEKLRRRVAKLQVDLGYEEVLSVDHPEYKQGLAALRDQQVHRLLKDIERDVAVLGSITQERKQSGASSSLTRSQQRRAKSRRKRIRQLVDSVAAWQQYELPASNITGQLPAQWSEQVITSLFKGTFPWKQPADGDAASVPALLAEQFRDACAEVRPGGSRNACGKQCTLNGSLSLGSKGSLPCLWSCMLMCVKLMCGG
jgi:hypothetical protein